MIKVEDMDSAEAFRKYSIDKLRQSAQRIDVCLGKLTDDQIWMRGSDSQNAVGNLVLHLCGNIRQWILTGVAGAPDARQRDQEFAARAGYSAEELKQKLAGSIEEVCAVVERLPAEDLSRRIEIQKYNVTVLEAVYHVVEHFSYHTGQIVFATKWATGEDMGFYRHLQQLDHTETTP